MTAAPDAAAPDTAAPHSAAPHSAAPARPATQPLTDAPHRRRGGSPRHQLARAVILLGPVLNIAMQTAGYLDTPPQLRPEIAWTTLHAAVSVIFAASAIVALGVGERRLPIFIMAAISYLWIPQTFFSVISDLGWLWPVLRSIDLAWALALGMLALSYPSGRYRGRVDHVVVVIGVGVSVVRVVSAVLLNQPDQATCDCAPNAYAVVEDSSFWSAIDLGYRIIGAAIVMFVAGRLLWRWLRAGLPARTVAFVMPIGLIAWTLALVVEAVSFAAVREDAETLVFVMASTGPIAIISLFAVASVPICYVAGSLHLRATRGRVADLMRITRDGAPRGVWRDSLAAALGDPGVEVYWWDDAAGEYRDDDGAVVDLPVKAGAPSRTLLPITAGDGSPIAVIRHDRALSENERLLDGVSTALRLSVDNGELRSEVERTLEHVRESRQRIVEAGNEARKRLERNLHDGSQQQLVALSMELRTICTSARAAGQHELADELETVITRLTTALRELRELAHGIHPTVLAEGGLGLAMPELASRCPVPVVVEGDVDRRLPELVESTAYFVAAECLVNVARHSGARQAWLRVDVDDERVRLEVRDNGRGGASTEAGTGLLGLVDRVEAVGGTLQLRSPEGGGTTVTVHIPTTPPAPATAPIEIPLAPA